MPADDRVVVDRAFVCLTLVVWLGVYGAVMFGDERMIQEQVSSSVLDCNHEAYFLPVSLLLWGTLVESSVDAFLFIT